MVKSLPLLFVLTQLGHVTGPQGHGTSSLHSPLSTVQAPGRGLLQGGMALPTYVALAASGPPLTEHDLPRANSAFQVHSQACQLAHGAGKAWPEPVLLQGATPPPWLGPQAAPANSLLSHCWMLLSEPQFPA